MFLKIKVHPGSKKDCVVRKADDSLEVFVRTKAVEGRANESMIGLLSDYLHVPTSKLRLIRGGKARNKIVERTE